MTIDVTPATASKAGAVLHPRVYCEPVVRELPTPAPEPASWARIW